MHWNDDPAWAGDGKTIHVKCDYRLVVDNLMDLTHETFVHGGSIGNEAVAEAPFDVTHGDKTVTVTRWMKGIEAPPFWAAQLQKPGPVDRWQIIRFEAPGTVNIDVGVAPAGTGAPEGDRSQGVNGYVLNTMTPETATTSVTTSGPSCATIAAPNRGSPRKSAKGVSGIFHEDEIILEAQRRAIDENPDRAVSQTVRAQLALRDQILSGGLRSGERISEFQAVETTGVSRTPVRMALVRLEEEGLLEAIPSSGFMVKAFSERDILDSIELRSVLEGMAARFAAERGVSARDLEPKESLSELDQLVARNPISEEAFSSYVTMNARFHALLTELSRSAPLIRQIDRASALPFASPSGFVMAQSVLPEAHQILIIAQDHHRIVVDAIENREGARAEAVMREHARLAARNLRLALRNRTHLDLLPALALIRSPE
jgi:GntR family transcriptional regulator, vanillate catabolism transcriptional regulator